MIKKKLPTVTPYISDNPKWGECVSIVPRTTVLKQKIVLVTKLLRSTGDEDIFIPEEILETAHLEDRERPTYQSSPGGQRETYISELSFWTERDLNIRGHLEDTERDLHIRAHLLDRERPTYQSSPGGQRET